MSKEYTFVAGSETVALVDELKATLGLRRDADVFRNALALLRLSARESVATDYVVRIGECDVSLRRVSPEAEAED